VRVRVTRPTRAAPAADAPPFARPTSTPAPAGTRDVHFADAGGFVPTPVHRWADLEPGARVTGPAIVQADDTSVVVVPGRAATVDGHRNLIVTR